MRRFAGRAVVALALATSLGLATPLIALAKSSQSPAAVQAYQVALRAYNHAKVKIDQTFHQAMVNARLVELDALSSAQNPAQSLLARAQFNVARATAITTWDSALKKLGQVPKPFWRKSSPTASATATSYRDPIVES